MIWVDANPGDTTGWLGTAWNASTDGRTFEAIGYPADPNPPFDGETMDHIVGTFTGSHITNINGLTNDNMQDGSSGGPWLTDVNGERLYVNSLQSHHYIGEDAIEYGPYFNDNYKRLYDWISNPANRT